jgi:hypothetical protein
MENTKMTEDQIRSFQASCLSILIENAQKSLEVLAEIFEKWIEDSKKQ